MEEEELERLLYNASILEEEGIPEPYGLFAEFVYYLRKEGDVLAMLVVTGIINVGNPKEAYRFKTPYSVKYVLDYKGNNPRDYVMENEHKLGNDLLELFSCEYDEDEMYNKEVLAFKERIKAIN